ncbi:MAG: AMP-binding protein [Chitinophagaceae bacterium]|nr:AMP-binding protein [Chitinophagaceae bacterium]
MLLPLAQFLEHAKNIPTKPFLKQPEKGIWKTWTYQEARDEASRIAAGLKKMGIEQGDRVAILSKNCAHWVMSDLAIMMTGAVSVPIYPSLSAHAIEPILKHSGTKIVIVGKLDDFSTQEAGIPANVKVISVNRYGVKLGESWEQLSNTEAAIQNIYDWQPEDLLTIIYTSGTTGVPKGVMHRAYSFAITLPVAFREFSLPYAPNLFSYLPMSHIAERLGLEINALYHQGTLHFAESLKTFPQNLKDTQPDLFFAVPRIWAKFQEGVLKKLPQKKLDLFLKIPILSSIIKNKIKTNLGLKKATHIFSGAAPISVDMLKWFEKIGITIYQAYGMTEDAIYAHFNRPGVNKFGSVGKKISGLESKISLDGEVLVKSEGNMRGYYKEPEITAAAFDEEGYLRTGDIGHYDEEGFLFLTGRLKDQFKTDKGKFISPAPIELEISKNEFIEMNAVVGMGIPQPIALVVLSAAGKAAPKEELIQSLESTLKQLNPELEHHEQVKKIVIMKEDWSIENNMLTPTLKIKRNELEKLKVPIYPKWYEQKGAVIWE